MLTYQFSDSMILIFFLMISQPPSSLLFPYTPLFFFFFNDTATTEIYTLSLHDALPICGGSIARVETGNALRVGPQSAGSIPGPVAYGRDGLEPTVTDANLVLGRSEEHTSELQSLTNLVCRLLLEKKKTHV